jgi:hypothetical protein
MTVRTSADLSETEHDFGRSGKLLAVGSPTARRIAIASGAEEAVSPNCDRTAPQ